ncbi:MAG: NTP transferase domain-containing protein [Candidatus Omnitrophica bacterium]|nr:NTP transferase domain-containing protein [Candidatus Omnitrophota bacterium]
MKIEKAVILAAGLGTRLLPATRSQPKEMLPVGRKPIIQYVLEEIRKADISKILIVTGKMKRAIEDYFEKDRPAPFYIRQGDKKGTAGALLPAEPFVENEPFLVAFGDSLIKNSLSAPSLLERMIKVHQKKRAAATLAIEEVALPETEKYGVVKTKNERGGIFQIVDIIEKPGIGESPGNLVLAARFIFEPIIFEMIHLTKPYHKEELRLTDSLKLLMRKGHPVYGVKLKSGEKRYDVGSFESYYKTFLELALFDKEFGKPLKIYLKNLLKGRRNTPTPSRGNKNSHKWGGKKGRGTSK